MTTLHLPIPRNRGLAPALPRDMRDRRPCSAHARGNLPRRVGRFAVATERLDHGCAAIRLAGELDLAAGPVVAAALRRVELWSVWSVVVDAAEVSFVDLTVIGSLAAAHHRLEAVGGGLMVINPPDCMLRLLDVLVEIGLPVVR